GADPPRVSGRARDLPEELAIRDGSVRPARLIRPRQGGHRVIAETRARSSRGRFDRRSAPGRLSRHPPSRGGGRARTLSRQRSGRAGDGVRRGAQSKPHGALSRSGSRARSSGLSRHLRADDGRAPSPDHALLPDALDHAPTRILGRSRRNQDTAPGDRRRAPRPHASLRRPPVTARQRTDRRTGLLYLSPALVVLGGTTIYPAVWVFWLSLQHRIPIFDIAQFAGLDHYAFLAIDPRFWNALCVTVAFTVVSVAFELGLGLLAALLLRSQSPGRQIALSLLLLPWALPAVVTAKLFEWLYHPTAGLVSALLGGHRLNWLGDPHLALAGVIWADVWRTM